MRKSNGYAKTNDDETSKQVGENKEDYSRVDGILRVAKE
jgi:hypothetical protein